jgi:hypothetical protein
MGRDEFRVVCSRTFLSHRSPVMSASRHAFISVRECTVIHETVVRLEQLSPTPPAKPRPPCTQARPRRPVVYRHSTPPRGDSHPSRRRCSFRWRTFAEKCCRSRVPKHKPCRTLQRQRHFLTASARASDSTIPCGVDLILVALPWRTEPIRLQMPALSEAVS